MMIQHNMLIVYVISLTLSSQAFFLFATFLVFTSKEVAVGVGTLPVIPIWVCTNLDMNILGSDHPAFALTLLNSIYKAHTFAFK